MSQEKGKQIQENACQGGLTSVRSALTCGSHQRPPRGLEISALVDSPAGSKEEGRLCLSASAPGIKLPLPLANRESLGVGCCQVQVTGRLPQHMTVMQLNTPSSKENRTFHLQPRDSAAARPPFCRGQGTIKQNIWVSRARTVCKWHHYSRRCADRTQRTKERSGL